ncbi:MAG: universal stress protein [Euryarchaeota archaeon]|nr:universal stress protein [Euryarchaeota archaeon]
MKPPKTTWNADAAWHEAEFSDMNRNIDAFIATARSPAASPGPRAIPRLGRILVAVDGTGGAAAALAWARRVATLDGGRVWAIVVLPPSSMYAGYARKAGWKNATPRLLELDERNGQRILDAAVDELRAAHVPAEGLLVRGFPAAEINKAARNVQADLVVVGSHGHGGRKRFLLGSVADGIKEGAPCSVLIAKRPPGKGEILAPVDGSEPSRLAGGFALRLAHAWRRKVVVVHVYEVPWLGWPEDGPYEFREIVRNLSLNGRSRLVSYEIGYGHPGKKLIQLFATRRPDLVVMGSRGLGPLRAALTGSVSNRVAHESPASVLLVR